MKLFRVRLRPTEIIRGVTDADIFQFCQKRNIIGIGWCKMNLRSDDDDEIKTKIKEIWPEDKSGFRNINRFREMKINDLIWTEFEGIYYLCRVDGKVLWKDSKATEYHMAHDMGQFVSTEWQKIGIYVPKEVENSLSITPSHAADSITNKEIIRLSQEIWNKTKSNYEYPIKDIS